MEEKARPLPLQAGSPLDKPEPQEEDSQSILAQGTPCIELTWHGNICHSHRLQTESIGQLPAGHLALMSGPQHVHVLASLSLQVAIIGGWSLPVLNSPLVSVFFSCWSVVLKEHWRNS